MSSGGKGGAAARSRVAIPSSVKKMIDHIKEITGQNHGEDEIYATLKECSMDPNETAQKLLLLDAFHEVKKRRDRRRENLNKEPAQSRLKQGTQSQVNRAGRGNYSPKPLSHDHAGGGSNSSAVKENLPSHISEKVVCNATLGNTQKIKKDEASSVASPITDISNCPSGITSQSTNANKDNIAWANGSVNKFNRTKTSSVSKLEEPLPFSSPNDSNKNLVVSGPRNMQQIKMLDSSNSAISLPSVSDSGSQISSLDPLPLPSQDFPLLSAVNTKRCKVGSDHILVEQNADNPSERNIVITVPQKMPNDFPGVGKNHHLENMQTAPSRPSSDYDIQSQVIVPQKESSGKEWKPKSTNPSVGQNASRATSYDVSAISVGSQLESQHTPSEEANPELQRKLEDLHISNTRQVVIPNHLQVLEAGKLGFCFGSFDASFGLEMTQDGSLRSNKSIPLSESSDSIGDPVKGLQLSNQTVPVAGGNTEIKYPDHTQSRSQGPEDFSSGEVEALSSVTHDHGESGQEVTLHGHQYPVVHTSSYNYGHVPPMLNGQLTPSVNSESQAHGSPQLPGFVMQQSFDPMSYYAQFYRSSGDSDGRISPFNSAGAANKYNGNAGLISAQTSQPPEEGNAPHFMSTASPVPLSQAAGVMQSSISANQQHLPVFRQPTGIHLPHYPPFIPYAPYFSPYYIPPHALQFFSSGAFPQQPLGGNLYPNLNGTTPKNSISKTKQGSNIPSSTHVVVPVSHGSYIIPLANYNSSSVTEALSSTSNEEVKENNVYASNEQTEGLGAWQGQLAFAPTQTAQGTYANVYHPAHAVHPLLQQSQPFTIPIDMMGPTAGVYPPPPPQQQHAQLNWPSNF
ncbi:hypothetical protein C2S53_006712 [Perilla frutescens var. hirtella]|uniref:GBF-interacting protein 1 N-terminal domain-containing protein n=1 Tax=Perilla frutescens var. hirtella TaxID=608512 RepID=A0AAD4IQ59_PERFH|nr:hypothetical protein C2S53_006712 [Perilla frutescens var. hirtella]